MAAVPVTLNGVLYDLYNRTTQRVIFFAEASLSDVGIGGGPIFGGGAPGVPAHPIVPPGGYPEPGHPIVPPGGYPKPEHPIVIPDPPVDPPPVDPGTDPGVGVKPPPDDGGWGYVAGWGWGYFPGADAAGPKTRGKK